MNIIATIRDSDFGWPDGKKSEYTKMRSAARAILLDENNRVGLMNATLAGYYKLAGGGIDAGETAEDALRREIREEAGYEVDIIGEVGKTIEWRKKFMQHQTSYCFLVKIKEFIGTALEAEEMDDGFELEWFSNIDAAIKAVRQVDLSKISYAGTFYTTRELKFLEVAKDLI